jgi:ABC-type molybdate transport system ATPase subunit
MLPTSQDYFNPQTNIGGAMKSQEKFGIAFWILVLLGMLWGLTGCTTASESITDVIKDDVKVIEKQIDVVEVSLPKECKTPIITAQLDLLKDNIKTISNKADSVELSCKVEKDVLNQRISKLHIIILGLIIACGLLIFVIIKRVGVK